MKKILLGLLILLTLGTATFVFREPIAMAWLLHPTVLSSQARLRDEADDLAVEVLLPYESRAERLREPRYQDFLFSWVSANSKAIGEGDASPLPYGVLDSAIDAYESQAASLSQEQIDEVLGVCLFDFEVDCYKVFNLFAGGERDSMITQGVRNALVWGAGEPTGGEVRASDGVVALMQELQRRNYPGDDDLTVALTRFTPFAYNDVKDRPDLLNEFAPVEARARAWLVTLDAVAVALDDPRLRALTYASEEQLRSAFADIEASGITLTAADIDVLERFCMAEWEFYGRRRRCIDLALQYEPLLTRLEARAADAGDSRGAVNAKEITTGARKLLSATPEEIVGGWNRGANPNERPFGLRPLPGNLFERFGDAPSPGELRVLAKASPSSLRVLLRTSRSANKSVATASAEALARLSPMLFTSNLMEQIDEYQPLLLKAKAGKDVDLDALREAGYGVEAGLRAIAQLEEPSDAILSWFRVLAIPVPEFSQMAAEYLKKQLDVEEFADGLFRFLAVRERFSVAEVKAYEQALESYRSVAPHIIRNLERMYNEAQGNLLRAPWIHKLIALEALAQVGDEAALPILRIYATDKDEYVDINTNLQTGEEQRTVKKFSDLARSAIAAIESR